VPVIEDKFLGSVRLQPVQALKLNEFLGALAPGGAYRCAENDGVVDDAHSNPASGRLGRSSAGAKLSHACCHGSAAVARGFPAEIAVPAIMAIRVRSQPNAYSDGFARHQFMQSCHHRRAILEFCLETSTVNYGTVTKLANSERMRHWAEPGSGSRAQCGKDLGQLNLPAWKRPHGPTATVASEQDTGQVRSGILLGQNLRP
jgi:hypothetical protein